MHLKKDNTHIIITFEDNPLAASIISNLPNRKYLPVSKCWKVPLGAVIETLDALAVFNFIIDDNIPMNVEDLL